MSSASKDYKVNGWYQGVVLRLSPFGAFVAVRSGSKWAEGYLKTSQIQGELELGAEVQESVATPGAIYTSLNVCLVLFEPI